MAGQDLRLWLADCRTDRAAAAVDLAAQLGAARLELPASAWETGIQDKAREAEIEPLAAEGGRVRSLTTGEEVQVPRAPELQPWLPDSFRRACTSEFLAAVLEPAWVAGPGRLAPAASVETHRREVRMQLVGAWVGGAKGIRLGPWPTWSELDPFGEAGSPVVEELQRFQSAVRRLTAGTFLEEPALILEPDAPDDEDLRRCFEAWLLLKQAGIHARRVPAAAAPRKVLNSARLIVIPGCWRLPEERWVNLGGWVRGGGTLYLGFDERALTEGYEPGWGPPGPGFLERLVGMRAVGTPPYPRLEGGKLRLRFRKGDHGFADLKDLPLSDLEPMPVWPLDLPGREVDRAAREGPVEVLALGPGQSPAVWRYPLRKGLVVATALPFEALLARQAQAYEVGAAGHRPSGPILSRFFFYLARAAGLTTGGAPMEPFTDLAVSRSRGGYPHGLVVVNRRDQRAAGRIALHLDGGFEASDLLQERPVALMKGSLVCPVEAWNYRVVGLSRKGSASQP